MGNRYTYKTLEEWCVENNRQDILDLWDYDKNDKTPSEIPYATRKRYFFKCPQGIHESEQRIISSITDRVNRVITCQQCGGVTKRIELTGNQYGELTVVGYDQIRHDNGHAGYWICNCSCGETVSVSGIKLRGGLKNICWKNGKHKYEKKPINSNSRIGGNQMKKFRNTVLERCNNTCIICGEQLADNEVHHIFPYAQYATVRHNPNNGVCIAKRYHSTSYDGSFHREYGTTINNTPENFEKYVNEKRKELGITEHFDVYEYTGFDENVIKSVA